MMKENDDSTDVIGEETEGKDKVDKMKVNSTAIVTYTSSEPPAPVLPYAKLQQDTNLNIAPSNWLRDGRFSDVFPQSRKPVDFSSFGIAHTFLDSIGDVDVISDAENIKKLLKMPHSKGEISLAVHRIGRTLLLDDLDLPALLSYYASQTDEPGKYSWLYDFYCEQNGIPKGADFKKKKNRNQARERDILSKFLHYSIQKDGEEQRWTSTAPENKPSKTDPGGASGGDHATIYPIVNESEEEDPLPEPQQRSPFKRNVLWRFEDIHMLVGSNLPIFGGGKYPAVSLRLRECDKPINVLTGLDYWLDNLMCNVPEVAMCYHLDGIVQFYDLYKTEDLPHLDNSSFSPQVVKDIAQNMLSFMKSNCTQEGHTYWLYKANDSEVVKLYDLTSICDQRADGNYQNFFTVPVAMLFFRVAKNMMKQGRLDARDQGTVRLLLDNCLTLIEEHNFPEIVASANFLLSDLYSPDTIHIQPALDSTVDSERNSREDLTLDDVTTDDDTDRMASEQVTMVDVHELFIPGMYPDDFKQMASMLTGNAEKRCKVALSHVVKGLLCLQMAPSSDDETEGHHDNQHPVSPQNPLASTVLTIRHVNKLEPSSTRSLPLDNNDSEKNPLILVKPVSWKSKSTAILLRKATSIYHSMACLSNSNGKYGRGLRYCKLGFKCFEAYRCVSDNTSSSYQDGVLLRSILCACSDAYLMLAKSDDNLLAHHEHFTHLSRDDQALSESADEYVSGSPDAFYKRMEFTRDREKLLVTSVEFYEAALDLMGKDTQEEEFLNIARRVGNVKNELGVHFMNRAATAMRHGDEPTNAERDLWRRSFSYFESGIRAFEAIEDRANIALLFSNSGRLMRLCAQAVVGNAGQSGTSRGQFSQEERAYFNKAIEFYNQALRSLAERRVCPEVWDTVTWELSGAYYSMAVLLQDFPPLSQVAQQQVEKEVTELMMKALKICEPTGSKSVVTTRPQAPGDLEKRLGGIHHRLASLYHNAYRNEGSDQAKKKQRSLAELHYTKTCMYFKPESLPCEWIRVQLERVAMCEYQMSLHSGSSAAIKTLQTALGFLLDTRQALISGIVDERSTQGDIDVAGSSSGELVNAGPSRDISDSEGTNVTREREPSGAEREPSGAEREPSGADRGKSRDDEKMQKVEEATFASSKGNDTLPLTEGVTSQPDVGDEYQHLDEELKVLIPILESRLNNTLKELVKALSQKGRVKSTDQASLDKGKRMYSVALRASMTLSTKNSSGDVRSKAKELGNALVKLDEIRNS